MVIRNINLSLNVRMFFKLFQIDEFFLNIVQLSLLHYGVRSYKIGTDITGQLLQISI